MGDGVRSENCLLRDAVELHTLLQPIASIENDVWVSGAKPSQAGRQQLILTLLEKTIHSF